MRTWPGSRLKRCETVTLGAQCAAALVVFLEEISDRSAAMFLASVLVLLLVSVFAADALPGGAPAAACTNGLTPQHGAQPQVGMSPYELDLSAFNVNGTLQYTPGTTYTRT